MRLRNNPQAKEILKEHHSFVLDKETNIKEQIQEIYDLKKPIHLEIGMGKGDFILEMAHRHPDISFIGIEKFGTVLVVACKKIVERLPDNLKVMNEDATELLNHFENHSIDTIYLNFSDPWPKKKHDKRRLTYPTFLKIYQTLLKKDGYIEFKTDNRGLFEYSLISMNQFGMIFEEICLDLHKSVSEEDNVMSEYEKKFSSKGPIYKIKARFK